jgi:uncharacterized phage protein (TIGR02218 family)
MEVKTFTSPTSFVLQLPMPYTVTAADTFSVYAGCDKTRTTCINRFGNILNFRGEPDLPGLDKMIRPGGV